MPAPFEVCSTVIAAISPCASSSALTAASSETVRHGVVQFCGS